MAFREKSAWIMFIALLLGGLFYWGVVITGSQELGASMPPIIPVIAIYVFILVSISIFGHIAAALTSPQSANEPADEREAYIMARSTTLSDHVMGLGILISLGIYMLSYDGNQLFHLIFGTLMTAQLAQYAMQIYLFRRQSAIAE